MEENTNRRSVVRGILRFVVGGLVELFIGAATNTVLNNVDAKGPARMGVKAGAFFTGMMIADQVSDFVADEVDDTIETIEKLQESIHKDGE